MLPKSVDCRLFLALPMAVVTMLALWAAALAASDSRPNLAKAVKIVAKTRIAGEQAQVARMVDEHAKTWWSSGPGDLALNPVDVDLVFKQPVLVDTLVVLSSRFKGQLRLKDFDLFAGLGGAWDGAHRLAKIRENTEKSVRVRFPAVRLDRLRIRLLGTHRPDNAFAHIADLAVYAAAGDPQRQVEASPFPRSLQDAGHDPQMLRSLIRELASKAAKSPPSRARLQAIKNRLHLIEESQKYEAILQRISAETERYRQLGAPQWALAQRDCMARLRNWAYYWIDHQQPDGQFGGGYEDDVELVCGWPVLVLAQDDAKVRRSLELLAENVWKSRPFLEKFGYDRLTDVEHAAENTSYSQPRMVILDAGNPKWSERCRRTVATMTEHFLSRNAKGRLQFRSDHFGFDPRTLRPVTRQQQRPFDIPESTKALKPAMYAVWATGDETSKQTMLEVGRTWVEAAKADDAPGRIAGLLPKQVLWPSGRAVGTHAYMSTMRATLFHLIGCYYVSGEDRYLDPIRDLLEKFVVEWSVKDVPSAGTLSEVRNEDHVGLLEQLALVATLYRRATGDKRFDPHLARWTGRIRGSLIEGVKSYIYINRNSDQLWYVDRPLTVGAYLESRCSVGSQLYLGWLVSGEDDYLAKLGWNLSSCLSDKWGSFTYWFYDKSERRVTSNDHLAHKIQNSESALCLMYLGGPGPVEAVWPQLAVSWKDVGENFCALVRQDSSTGLRVQLYCFDPDPRTISAQLWELAPAGIRPSAAKRSDSAGKPNDLGKRKQGTSETSSNRLPDVSRRRSYRAVLGPDHNQDGQPDRQTWQRTFEVAPQRKLRTPTSVRFTLPARTLMALEIRPDLD